MLAVDDEIEPDRVALDGDALRGLAGHTAGSGNEAVKAARETRPDAIVLDMMLPDFDGLEVMRRIRTEDPTSR